MAEKRRGRGSGGGVLRFALTLIVLALVMTATLGFLYYYMEMVLKDNIRDGFGASDLVVPMDRKQPYSVEPPPLFISPGPPGSYSCRVSWPVNGTDGKLEGYPGIGAIINLSLENQGPTDLYIEKARVSTGWGSLAEWTVGKYVAHGAKRWLRHLDLEVPMQPPSEDLQNYTVSLTLLVEGGSSWTRVQSVEFDRSLLNVRPLGYADGPLRTRKNWRAYFDSVVPKVKEDLSGLREIVNASYLNGTTFSVQSLAEVQLWVLSKVHYESDKEGRDEWLSPLECLERGKGDCEDFAILYGAIITLLGGSARVMVTRDHAFNAIYIGGEDEVLSSLSERYDVDIPFQVLEDDLGKWVLIEPQSFLILGWFPLGILPVQGGVEDQTIFDESDLSWNYNDNSPVYVVDIYIQ